MEQMVQIYLNHLLHVQIGNLDRFLIVGIFCQLRHRATKISNILSHRIAAITQHLIG